jgi:hypothetical protein
MEPDKPQKPEKADKPEKSTGKKWTDNEVVFQL